MCTYDVDGLWDLFSLSSFFFCFIFVRASVSGVNWRLHDDDGGGAHAADDDEEKEECLTILGQNFC